MVFVPNYDGSLFYRPIMERVELVCDKELPKITKDVAIELAHTLGKRGCLVSQKLVSQKLVSQKFVSQFFFT